MKNMLAMTVLMTTMAAIIVPNRVWERPCSALERQVSLHSSGIGYAANLIHTQSNK